MIDPVKFDEYKALIDDTARFTERRQTLSNLYITVNSLLLTAMMFAIKDSGANQAWALTLALPIIVAGGFVCRWWEQLIKKYKELVGLRLNVLREMEDSAGLSGIERIYHREDALYPRNPDNTIKLGGKLNFSDLEANLPRMFLILYGLVGLSIIVILILRAYGLIG